MSILINDGNTSIDQMEKCDIGEFVKMVNELKNHMQMVNEWVIYTKSILQWERPFVTLFWIALLSSLIIMNPVYIFIAFMVPLPPLLLMEFVRTFNKQTKADRRYIDLFVKKEQRHQQILEEQRRKREDLDTYLDILIGLQRIFTELNTYFDSVNKLSKWKNPTNSFLLLVCILTVEFSLYLFDVRYFLLAMLFVVFFINNYLLFAIYRSLTKLKLALLPTRVLEKNVIACNNTSNHEQEMAAEIECVEDSTSSSDNGEEIDANKNSSLVENFKGHSSISKFFSRRRKKPNKGTCSGCGQSSSSILNKRRYCRHCGKSFCARCCNKRVPRSLLGATAPAAYQEKVLVCFSCHVFVTNRANTSPTEIVQ